MNELTSAIADYNNELIENSGEISKEMEIKLASAVDGFCKMFEKIDSESLDVDQRIYALTEHKKNLESKKENIKKMFQDAMNEHQIKKVEGYEFTVQINRTAPTLEVYAEGEIPASFFKEKTTFTLDKKAVKEVLALGEDVPGTRLIEGYSIKIKPTHKQIGAPDENK